MSGSKRPASPTTAAAEVPAQRMRLSAAGAVAADPPAAVRPPLSPAQRCATDTVTLAFEFFAFQELIGAARTCRAWLAAAVKVKPRSLCLTIEPADRMAAVCASSSPFKRHISRVVSGLSPWLSIEQLAQLSQLPQLTALEVQLNADDLIRLMDEQGGGALAKLRAAFPPQLRELILCLSEAHSTAACQLQLDALSAMEGLERLSLLPPAGEVIGEFAPLSLEPLLQLPRLTRLAWSVGMLTVSQLFIIKQIATLKAFSPRMIAAGWTDDQFSAFCRPPHRLQRLEKSTLRDTLVNEAAMADLACLPALTALEPELLTPEAYAFLPRFSRLQRLSVYLVGDAAEKEAQKAALVSVLPACAALTDLTLVSAAEKC